MADAPSKLDRELLTPEGVTLHLRLASAGARAGAFTVDSLIMLAVLIVFTLLALLAAWATRAETSFNAIAAIWLLGYFLLRNFYFVLMESGARAATFGKRLFRLRVVMRDGGRLTGGAVFARNLMREIEVYLPLSYLMSGSAEGFVDRWTILLGFAWSLLFLFFPLFNRDRLRAGDLIAGTWVIETERSKAGDDLMQVAAAARDSYRFTPAELSVYGQFELQRLEEVLRRNEWEATVTVAAAVRRKIGRPPATDDTQFLSAYYAALRTHLERKLLFGRRKRDKFDADS